MGSIGISNQAEGFVRTMMATEGPSHSVVSPDMSRLGSTWVVRMDMACKDCEQLDKDCECLAECTALQMLPKYLRGTRKVNVAYILERDSPPET
jgi:hypothetical protein